MRRVPGSGPTAPKMSLGVAASCAQRLQDSLKCPVKLLDGCLQLQTSLNPLDVRVKQMVNLIKLHFQRNARLKIVRMFVSLDDTDSTFDTGDIFIDYEEVQPKTSRKRRRDDEEPEQGPTKRGRTEDEDEDEDEQMREVIDEALKGRRVNNVAAKQLVRFMQLFTYSQEPCDDFVVAVKPIETGLLATIRRYRLVDLLALDRALSTLGATALMRLADRELVVTLQAL